MLNLYSKAQVMTTIAGTGSFTDSGDSGQALLANINQPMDVAIDKFGNILIAENDSPSIRKINKIGIITTPANIFTGANFVVSDSIGNIIVGSGLISKIDYKNNNVTEITGGGTSTISGIPAIQVFLYNTGGITFDNKQNLYVADYFRIIKIDSNGYAYNIAGTYGVYGYSGDNGPAINALFNRISGIKFDKKGNLYISDEGNNVIRKIDTNGIISTVVGTGIAGFSGDNDSAINATINMPIGLAFDSFDNLYFSDQSNNRIRKVDSTGIITTYAGSGGYGNADGFALHSTMKFPAGLAFDSANNLYIADEGNNLIRKVTPPILPVTLLSFNVSGFKLFNGNTNTAVKWETASEINTSYFNVQQSTDGINFNTIGKVKAKGAGTYSFNDPLTSQDSRLTMYYRLEIVDNNGLKTYSEIRSVFLTTDDSGFTISPNPAKDYITINGSTIKQITLGDISGRILISTKEKKINISSLLNGLYMVNIETMEGKRVVEKMVKM